MRTTSKKGTVRTVSRNDRKFDSKFDSRFDSRFDRKKDKKKDKNRRKAAKDMEEKQQQSFVTPDESADQTKEGKSAAEQGAPDQRSLDQKGTEQKAPETTSEQKAEKAFEQEGSEKPLETEQADTSSQNEETKAAEQKCSAEQKKIAQLEEELKKAKVETEGYLDRLRRTMAEFDNYRKRTEKEKEQEREKGIDSVLLSTVLPVLDNLERAKASIPEAEKDNATARGVDMIYQKVLENLKAIDVVEIKAEGEQFDPKFHNAVMHIEDEKIDENTVCEVFQKGYTHKGTVIRYSMVKVAN